MAKYRFSKPKPARVAPGWCHNSKEGDEGDKGDEHRPIPWLIPGEGIVCAACGVKVSLRQ